ncbi:MAG: bifunctional demethylmenaquinone methyltransferase/2-methoxy-6-polyprenyl-1,4-benzoquinol methylase UbiE [Deltaproteobacteria bacterium]|nr:bifunctional demethylmenaquinone methyltransferase/2-methoxy-6-polyprenyl-1,4-benzoquinol methylase UbiE [Deltaproteobacteria bacterium]
MQNSPSKPTEERSRENAFEMFNRIAPRYDLVNRVLSGGIDIWWRKKVVAALPSQEGLQILDVATGTGDLLVAMAKAPSVQRVLGVDVSEGMIEAGQHKLLPFQKKGPAEKNVEMKLGDALALEEYEGQFDVVTIAFGIRNVIDVDLALRQMFATLRPGGKLLVLEFSTPKNAVVAPTYNLYRKEILPRVGGWVSGNKEAYRYLDETIASFPSGDEFLDMMTNAGFTKCITQPLTFGVASLYEGRKGEA